MTTRFGPCFCFTDMDGDSISVVLSKVTAVRVAEGLGTNRPIEIRFTLAGVNDVAIQVTREHARLILDDLWLKNVPVPADTDGIATPAMKQKSWVTE